MLANKKLADTSHELQQRIYDTLDLCRHSLEIDIHMERDINYADIEETQKIVETSIEKLYDIGYFSDKKMQYILTKAELELAKIRYIASKAEFAKANKALKRAKV